jgi:hypothetical protein
MHFKFILIPKKFLLCKCNERLEFYIIMYGNLESDLYVYIYEL